jgi:hypothetical protein
MQLDLSFFYNTDYIRQILMKIKSTQNFRLDPALPNFISLLSNLRWNMKIDGDIRFLFMSSIYPLNPKNT